MGAEPRRVGGDQRQAERGVGAGHGGAGLAAAPLRSRYGYIDCRSNHCHGSFMGFYSDSDFAPDCSMGYLARRVFQLSSIGLEDVFASDNMTLIQWQALVSIYFDRGPTCAELARDLSYDKGATTRLIDTLVARDWVVRERDADDRRVINLALTAAGEAVAKQCRLRVIARWNEWLADWPAADSRQLVDLLQRLRDTLQTKLSVEGRA